MHITDPSALSPIIWSTLEAATSDAAHPLRNLTLGSIGLDGAPQMRMLVLRDVTVQKAQLALHTDIRSPKWAELLANPKVSVLGYDPLARQQVRMRGEAQMFGPGTEPQQTAWDALGPWTKTTYCGGPPGDLLDAPERAINQTPTDQTTAKGHARFGVIVIQIAQLDWFQHRRGAIQRAVLDYDMHGVLSAARWIAP